jgi:hypothetical protein
MVPPVQVVVVGVCSRKAEEATKCASKLNGKREETGEMRANGVEAGLLVHSFLLLSSSASSAHRVPQ